MVKASYGQRQDFGLDRVRFGRLYDNRHWPSDGAQPPGTQIECAWWCRDCC
jgi:hypothetical protein